MSASVWQPGGSSIAVNAENASLVQKFIASAGQTVFTLTQFSYVVGTGSIRVYRNGVKLAASEVTELTTTTFSVPALVLETGEVIECSAVLGSQDAVTAAAINAAASAAASAASATAAAGVVASVDFTKTSVSTFSNKTLDSSCDLSAASGQLAGFRNKLINGGFNIWQRGVVSVSGYTADRFFADISNATVYKSGIPSSPAGNFYAVSTVGTGSGFANPRQAIERDTVYTLRGKTVTFSGFTECSAGFVGTLIVTAGYSNSTDTIAGVSTLVATKSITPITSKVPFSLTFTVPTDAVGLTVGFNHTNTQSTGVQTAWGDFQLELGSIATPFENRPIGLELALCQRYFETGYYMQFACANAGYSNSYGSNTSYKVTKRALPTVTIYSGSGLTGTPGSALWNPGAVIAAATFSRGDGDGFDIQMSGNGSYTLVNFSYKADAEL